MARYVTSGAQYNPFDFNAMWKSAEAATQAHYAQGAQFAAMAEQMSPYEALKYNPVDANDYAQVQQYNKQLEDSLAKFQKNGLSGGSFQSFLQLSKDYATKIKPLEIGMKNRAEYDAYNKQIYANDQTAEIIKKGSDIPLSEFAKGSIMPKYVSGAKVQQQVAQIVSKFAQQPGDQIDIQSLNQYYDVIKQNTGLKFEEVLAYMKDPNMTSPKIQILNSIVQGVLNSTNGYSELNKEAKDRITTQAMTGVWNAVGTQQNNVVESQYWKKDASARAWAGENRLQEQWGYQKGLIESQINLNNAKANKASNLPYTFTTTGPIKPFGNVTGVELVEEKRNAYNEYMNYKNDPKNHKRPKAIDKSGLTEKDYEAKVKAEFDNTVFEKQRIAINPNSNDERETFALNFFNKKEILDAPVTRRGGSSKTTFRNIIPDKILKDPNKLKQYMANNFSVELNYATADPKAGLIIRNVDNDAVYYMPYSTFGSTAQNFINGNLEAIRRARIDPQVQNKEEVVSSYMGAILNIIYSNTVEPKQDTYKQPTQQTTDNTYSYE